MKFTKDKRFLIKSGRYGFGYMVKYIEDHNNQILFETDDENQAFDVIKNINDYFINGKEYPQPIKNDQPKLFIRKWKHGDYHYLVNNKEEYCQICFDILKEKQENNDWNFTIDNSSFAEILTQDFIDSCPNEQMKTELFEKNNKNIASNKSIMKHNRLAEKLNKLIESENIANAPYFLNEIDYNEQYNLQDFDNR